MDNSPSMQEHWDDVIGLFSVFAYFVKRLDNDDLEMYFTVSEDRKFFKNTSSAVSHLRKMRLGPISDTALLFRKMRLRTISDTARLREILERYRKELDSQVVRGDVSFTSKPVKPLSLYVLTDAAYVKYDIIPPLKAIVKKQEELLLDKHQLGIQFICFGSGADIESLELLMPELRRECGID